MSTDSVKMLSISELCNDDRYVIPIYQRNYAWEVDEIELLIGDILEAQKKNGKNNYYIGSLVVAKRKDGYEVVDGQQRLTTLKLLLTYYNKVYEDNRNIDLAFEYRKDSNASLANLNGKNECKNNIEVGYKTISNILSKKDNEDNNINTKDFFNFLLKNVMIVRTQLPEETDLNHYFEIMNTRGEQLEQHEILKARLMSFLNDEDRKLFALIWDACSDMSVYAIKRFPYSQDPTKTIRTSEHFFGSDLNRIPTPTSKDFDEMKKVSNLEENSNRSNSGTILSVLSDENDKKNNPNKQDKQNDENDDGKFNSIIDFPNFLMMAYKIFKQETLESEETPLNDKYLLGKINFTDKEEITDEDKNKVKEFIILLLKLRLIFDRYIIKTKENKEGWVLNRLKIYNNSKGSNFNEVNTFGNEEDNNLSQDKIIMLLSMFHVSFRQRIYKNWLFELLSELCGSSKLENKYNLEQTEYETILENLARKYYEKNSDIDKLLKSGQEIPNYIFNYLDYLLWRDWDSVNKNEEEYKFLNKTQFVFSLS
ncbi:uncharacterized protein DUF262 [Pasteurella langaaensis DSM 22999]|uniref:Uncharacterized protein DUF262 n=1 Tax=Alitibacter langaaensis DSM 22999 TaxID=1122935 RepID=A0A2U0TAP5_9PAST|nr:DUF262 domain-containing protein [Pasteurella langaaensis]PVX40649.1 uncharacterized protein DUF262 [Pasteurella langaaensis DSM 22999]